ncbi:hypothetical protein ACEPAH_4593 [Sanghuangporus vaninii]
MKPCANLPILMASSGEHDLTNGTVVKAEGVVEDVQLGQDESGPPEVWIKLRFTWAGKMYDLNVAESDRVYDLKSLIFSMTNVPPDRQKILGLVKGKLPPEEETISALKLTSGKKFSLVGTALGDELKDPSQSEEFPDVFNDLDLDFSENLQASRAYIFDRRNQRKIREATQRLRENLALMHPLREGKKLLVLDIDYTILDTKPLLEGSLPPIECARPGLHEFLEAIYPYYDICVWSQTSWVWLETKLHELGMIGSERNHYKINFGVLLFSLFDRIYEQWPAFLYLLPSIVLDKTCMFKVFSVRNGQQFPHHVKPLKIIWNLFPQYNASNTIHVDDLSRNFALNPGEGLKISAFKEAHTLRASEDRELEKLARYMVHIAILPDLKSIDHRDWKKIARSLRSEPQRGANIS